MHYIYCYTNKINGHQYVGQTNNIQRRIREHRSNSMNQNSNEYNWLFHKKFREYGEDNFNFTILEEINEDNINLINQREEFWINKLKTYIGDNNGGYNLTRGGDNHDHNRLYDDETIKIIKEKIKSGISFSEINKDYQISISHLSGINHGTYYFDPQENYPLYKYYQTEEELNHLVFLLQETTIPMTEIAQHLGKAYSTIKKINSGAISYNPNLSYPIRKLNEQQVKAKQIQQMLLNNESDEEIIKITGVSRATIKRINKGETHFDSTLKYPLR